MFKWKRFILLSFMIILSISIVFVVLGSTTLDEYPIPSFDTLSNYVDSNRYTHEKSSEIAVNQQTVNENYDKIETEIGDVFIDPVGLAFQVYNSKGYLWSSTINYEAENLSVGLTYPLRSALNIASYNINNPNYTILREHLFTPYTDVNLEMIENGFKAEIEFGTSKIQLNMYVRFTNEGITIDIPNNEIVEPGNFKLSSIQVYKDFGSVKGEDIPGYVFIPDGIGALIDYKVQTTQTPNYQKYIYGNTIGYNVEGNLNNRTVDGTRLYAPVFGFVHGVDQQAVFAEIESGGLYGNINVSYPGRNRGFTTVFPEFIYRNTYSQPIDKIGTTITLLQDFINDFDIKIRYNLLEDDDANYVGMAKTYRMSLMSKDMLSEQQQTIEQIPLHLSTIGLERKDGILFTENILMTTLKEFKNMIDVLNESDIIRIIATLDGYTKNGASWSAPDYDNLSKKVGSKADLSDLASVLEDLYLTSDFMFASSRSGGYNQYLDLAKKINDQLYSYSFPTDQRFLLEYQQIEDTYRRSLSELKDYAYTGFAIKSFGSLLYDDFSNDLYLSDQIELLNELLASTDKHIALYDANDYMWSKMDDYFDFPMYSSQFLTFDDTVPFLSIALSNTMDLYGPYANFYPYARDELLRMIDFHVYPSFIVTNKSSKYLQDTGLESIYSSKFTDLQPAIETYYHFVNDALKYTVNAHIIDRDILADGVSFVFYSNGVYIMINYTNQAYQHGSITIPAKNYVVGGIL